MQVINRIYYQSLLRKDFRLQPFYLLLHLSLLLFLVLGPGCTKISFITDADADIAFSVDTLTFDTVFTARGTATRSLKVYNPHDQFISVERIWLDDDRTKFFRMNVDGIPGNEAIDVEIPPNDSIYIFLEVTVDPDQPLSVSPFVIDDRLNFMTNGNAQEVVLEAWGQNANYLPDLQASGTQSLFTCNLNEWIWDDPRPYVIFGALVIDSCTLVMPEGTQVYVHGGFGYTDQGSPYNDGILFFFNQGRLRIDGSFENPVVIQGDRLESAFADVPGQWGRIQLGALTKGHAINHAIIKNGIIGLLVDSLAELTIRNSEISNTSSSGLVGYQANIEAENCLFHSSGGNNVTIILGGNYDFTYCTLANYGTATEALRATNFTCLDGSVTCNDVIAARLNMNFTNSIIFGSSRDEISLVDAVGEQDPSFFRYRFDHCIVKVDELLSMDAHPDFFDFCDPCTEADNEAILFASVDENDYHLDSLSIAEMMAKPIATIRRDIDGVSRDLQQPDIGCYEFISN